MRNNASKYCIISRQHNTCILGKTLSTEQDYFINQCLNVKTEPEKEKNVCQNMKNTYFVFVLMYLSSHGKGSNSLF